MTKQEQFIKLVTAGAIEGYKKYGVLPSLTIAQAILESGWGLSHIGEANNYFGIKAGSSWKGLSVTVPTKEFENGKWITINAKFRKYRNVSESISDHAKLIHDNERYANLIGEKDYKKATTLIKRDGYATDPTYTKKLQSLIEQYNLDDIDKKAFEPAPVKPKTKPVPTKPVTYCVRKGDTLSEIAARYKTTAENIAKLSKIKVNSILKIGKRLRIK